MFSGPGRTADDVISRDSSWIMRCSIIVYSYILNGDMSSDEIFYYRLFCKKTFVLIFEV